MPLVLLLAASILVAAGVSRADAPPLLLSTSAVGQLGAGAWPPLSRLRFVEVDVLLLESQPADLELALFDDTVVTATSDRIETTGEGNLLWVGHDPADPSVRVSLILSTGGLVGSIRSSGRVYSIYPSTHGTHAVIEHAPSSQAIDVVAGVEPEEPAGVASTVSAAAAPLAAGDDGSEIDLLVGYTSKLRSQLQISESSIRAAIELWVDEMNTDLANSQVPTRFRLVHIQETQEDEPAGYDPLPELVSPNDGHMDDLAAVREAYEADVTFLWVSRLPPTFGGTRLCGITEWRRQAAVGEWSNCAHMARILAHELGHTLNGRHREAHRFTDATGVERETIMASPLAPTDIPHYSNPDVLFDGIPTGVTGDPPDRRNNALLMTNAAPQVASFRLRDTLQPDDVVAQLTDPSEVVRVDPATGNGVALPSDTYLLNLVLEGTDHALVILDGGCYTVGEGELAEADLATGDLVPLLSDQRLCYAALPTLDRDRSLLMVSNDGNGAVSIIRVDRQTNTISTISSEGLLDTPMGLAVTTTGRIFVLDWGSNLGGNVIAIDRSSGSQSIVADVGSWRMGLIAAPDGSLLVGQAVAGSTLLRIHPDSGTMETIWLNPAWGLGAYPIAGGFTSDGDLIIGGGSRIFRVDPSTGVGVPIYFSSVNDVADVEVARALLPTCSDYIDNDGDGATDYPADPGCSGLYDPSEESDCQDGDDNDRDGFTDYPADPGCSDPLDASEQDPAVACDDGADNDGDALTDYPFDPGCSSPADTSERSASLVCDDGVDSDGDTLIDFGADPGCDSPADGSEKDPALVCDDGLDEDGDGLVDFPADPGCHTALDATEEYDCSDGRDNDGDGKTDYPDDPGCRDAGWFAENPACNDNLDNDGDGKVDYDGGSAGAAPDPQCSGKPYAYKESCGLIGLELLVPLGLARGWRRRRKHVLEREA